MALKNTMKLSQMRVQGLLSKENLVEWAQENLTKKRFQSIDQSNEEMSIGWVLFDHNDRADFDNINDFSRGKYLAFTLRKDQRKVPPVVIRQHLEKACLNFLAENPGLQKVPKGKKEEMRENIKLSLLQKTIPVPSTVDLVWDTEDMMVYLNTASTKTIEAVDTLFRETFEGFKLISFHPFARAQAVVEPSMAEQLNASNNASTDAVLELIQENTWIGEDLFCWLLHQSVEGSQKYKITKDGPFLMGEDFIAYLDNRINLLGAGSAGVQKMTISGPQDNFREVKTALIEGKHILGAMICFEREDLLWKMTLKGDVFHFTSVKMPAVKIEKNEGVDEASEHQAVFFERMHLIESGLQLFDSLFAAFLNKRLSPQWTSVEKSIIQWLSQ